MVLDDSRLILFTGLLTVTACMNQVYDGNSVLMTRCAVLIMCQKITSDYDNSRLIAQVFCAVSMSIVCAIRITDCVVLIKHQNSEGNDTFETTLVQ